MANLLKLAGFITGSVSLWVMLGAVVAFLQPQLIKPIGQFIPYLLGIIMLGMGLTMTTADFKLVLSRPKDVCYGVLLRYLIMPGVAWVVIKVLALEPALAAGILLVGCCPSGTASNVMTFIAKGDTALSITVSSVNTLLSPLLTPLLFLVLGGTVIPVDTMALLLDIVKIVVVPILVGMAIRFWANRWVSKLQPVIPALSVVAIVITVSAIVALNAAKLAGVAVMALAAVALHNLSGLLLGYWSSTLLGMSESKARAIAYEIGMENSGLAVALALVHLDPVAAIPGAIFSVWHNFSGSLLASYWVRKSNKKMLITS
ncbi:bile acid:sodium symporter family protein|uniref:Bile acid:Na+ symporter, BASS family n=1 Tax=Dendrosporobacter quercicolus TaxID=146817 RepID=A0A1G9RQE2_9FIRM|nr:bile acid:sodium symporter family protein [Dendrosporobacter quercicolus]NSL49380.1 bile acid:sodium symporter family protein [Dendrosporobacter quercicolus DSM 1736]SDM25403.1 bile acid:Na+ symporter, BASS family [Dendrosporobacter quercicolus]